MITAAHLKEHRIKKTENALRDIEHAILKAEAEGKRFIQYNLSKQFEAETIVTALIMSGFKATRHTGADGRGDSWDYIHIAWS